VAVSVQVAQAAASLLPCHTHASALIAAGIDIVQISQRLGHKYPNVTLRIYAHHCKPDDRAAVRAIEAARRVREANPGARDPYIRGQSVANSD
jgi:hypothetical protein